MSYFPRTAPAVGSAASPLALAIRLVLLTPMVAAPVLAATPQPEVAPLATGTSAAAETQVGAVLVTASQDAGTTEGSGSYTAGSTSTATKLPLTLRETPQSVTVVTREKMDDFNQTSINQVLEGTAGVTVEKIETDRTYYSSRGFDITNFQVDGLGLPMANGNVNGDLDTAIYDRVEVIRGATGLMTGAGNPSATVNMVRKRPTQEFQASVKGSAGSWENGRGEMDVSGSLVESGKLRGRTVLVKQNKESYLDRYATDKTVIYGVVEGDVAANTLLTLGYSLQQNDSDSPMWGALPLFYTDGSPTDYDVSTSTSSDWSYWNVDNRRAFAELSHDFGSGWQGKAVYNFIDTRQDSRLFYIYGTPDKTTGEGLLSYPGLYQMHMKQHVADVTASGPFRLLGREHQLVVGGTVSRSTVDELSLYSNDIGTKLPPLENWDGSYTQPAFDLYPNGSHWTDKEVAGYLAARFSVLRDLSWIVGSRLTSWETEGQGYGTVKSNSAHGVLTPYTGLVYDLTDQWSTYASYTTIFTPQKAMDINREQLDPIDGISYETGFKGAFFDGGLNTSLALFQTRQNNLAQIAGVMPGNATENYYEAVDGVRSQGYELEASGMVRPDWQLAASYTDLSIQDADGNATKTYTPKKLIKLASSYQLAKLKLGGSLNWQDAISRVNGAGTTTQQGSYALLNLMARYDFNKQWHTQLNIDNVTDKKYLNSLYWDQGFYGAPRSFMLTAGWRY
jgi:outer-membrane receptor for ferric coprogen and ferric-rhodotorulic acid